VSLHIRRASPSSPKGPLRAAYSSDQYIGQINQQRCTVHDKLRVQYR
jgi:hypothetical protein